MKTDINDISYSELDRTPLKFICIDNTPRVFKDSSTDEVDLLLTINKIYYGFYSSDKSHVFLEKTDKGGFPRGHRWIASKNLKLFSDYRNDRLNELGII